MNYRYVLIPKFDYKMARKKDRVIGRNTTREMYTLAHYRFRMRLIDKAREHPWCRVVEVHEDYTTKTCGRCGTLRDKLHGSKMFDCRAAGCGYVADRDFNAARNVLL